MATEKTLTVFKLVWRDEDGTLWSIRAGRSPKGERYRLTGDFRLQYRENEVTIPKVPNSRLYVWTDQESAERYLNEALLPERARIELWKCEAFGDVKHYPRMDVDLLDNVKDWMTDIQSCENSSKFATVSALQLLQKIIVD